MVDDLGRMATGTRSTVNRPMGKKIGLTIAVLAMLSAAVTSRQMRVLLIAGLDRHEPVTAVIDRLLGDVLEAYRTVKVKRGLGDKA